MNKNEIKRKIIEIIISDENLKNSYEILLKNKMGYMRNYIQRYCASEKSEYRAYMVHYFTANSDENTKKVYTSHINHEVKAVLEKSLGSSINNEIFNNIMAEVIDDLADLIG